MAENQRRLPLVRSTATHQKTTSAEANPDARSTLMRRNDLLPTEFDRIPHHR